MKKCFIFIVLMISSLQALCHKNLVLIAAPGTGKGTLSQYLVANYGYIQICPGDMFRAEIAAGTDLGKRIQPIVDKGEYVDEETVCKLIKTNLLKTIQTQKPFILDGFPRSEVSFNFLYNFLSKKSLLKNVCFLQLIANDSTCIKRILTRQICSQCPKVYNTESARPTKHNKCDDCKVSLIARMADTNEIAQSRLKYFHSNIEPLIATAKELYEVKKIETECPIEALKDVYESLVK